MYNYILKYAKKYVVKYTYYSYYSIIFYYISLEYNINNYGI